MIVANDGYTDDTDAADDTDDTDFVCYANDKIKQLYYIKIFAKQI